ncbi:MAG: MinD/ParA family protein [Lachnospirales bacterium]
MMDQASTLRELYKEKNEEISEQITEFSSKSKVISISSGKGGVGKSTFVVNLAISIANNEKKVVIIDADIGLANIEVLFGALPKYNLLDVIHNNVSIETAISQGPSGIHFLSGGSGLSQLVTLNAKEQTYLISLFKYLDENFDYIIIDNGAGVNEMVINFIKSSNNVIIVTTPEPTSIADAYTLIKMVTIKSDITDISLVVNKSTTESLALETHKKMNIVAEKFLDIKIKYLGYLPNDGKLVESVINQRPIYNESPNSKYVKSLNKITENIINTEIKTNDIPFAKKLMLFFKQNK